MSPRIPTASLSTASLRIMDLLADPFLFAVPLYQRPYSWTQKEASQLLEDVVGASGVDNPESAEPDYFLGAILLLSTTGEQTIPTGGEPRVYDIIDGQQRLVTLAILACALRDLDDSDGDDVMREIEPLLETAAKCPDGRHSAFRLELRERQQTFLEACVFEEGGCSQMPDTDTLGEAERRILEIREHFIQELVGLDPQQRLDLARYIKTSCYFVVMLTRDIDRAHRMFVVLNGRGKPLTRHDILKAEILNKVPAQAADRAVAAWDSAAERLDEDKFEAFFSHVRAIHGHYRPQVVAGIRAIINEVGGAEAFIQTVFEPLAGAYHQLLRPGASASQGPAAQVRRSLIYLHRLSGSEWMPAAMVAFSRHATNPALLAVQLAEIERFAHLLRLLCLGGGKRVRRFVGVIEALHADRSLSDADGPCQLSRDERRTIAYNLRDLHGRNQQACKLALLRLNDELSGKFNELEPGELSIEHILPQRTGATSPWRSWFTDAQEREDCVQSIGNLLLLTPRQNDRARNQEFSRKREIYGEARGGPLAPLSADVLAATQWRAIEIRTREAKFLQLLDRIWRIELVKDGPTSGPAASDARRQSGRRNRKRDN